MTIWNITLLTGHSEGDLRRIPGIDWPVKLVRHATARRYRLALIGHRQQVRLTLPRRAPEGPALAWAADHSDWIRSEIERAAVPSGITPGGTIPIEGVPTRIRHDPALGRRVLFHGAEIAVGGPIEQLAPRLIRWLRQRALNVLEAETRSLADANGLRLTSISIGDPRGRWGSCSTRGDIRYSWRLILAPPHVRQSTVAHEVAHLRHMDHSAAFHAFHRSISPADPTAARLWLRAHGRDLHAIGA